MLQPEVYLIAHTSMDGDDWYRWLDSIGAEGCTQTLSGADAEMLVELAGRRCYKSFGVGLNPNLTKVHTDSSNFHANLLNQGHGSVLEHASVTFAFENVSRIFTHELVRHRAGCAYSQESLRYVRLQDITLKIPDCINDNEEAKRIFLDTIADSSCNQKRLAKIFNLDSLPMKEKKALTSAFRRCAPMGLSTGIVATFNIRALRHILQMRTSLGAEEEMRIVFLEVYRQVGKRWPMLFQDAYVSNEDCVIFKNEKV